MTETFAVIDAGHFYTGVALRDDAVVRSAPIVRYMHGWTRKQVRDYCVKKGWKVFVMWEKQL